MILSALRSVVVVIDVQERLVPIVLEQERLLSRLIRLLKVATILEVPIVFSEQYPQGLGKTLAILQPWRDSSPVIQKVHFALTETEDFIPTFKGLQRQQILLTGVETHICVLQTALRLQDLGYQTYLVHDATSANNPMDIELACMRMRTHHHVAVVSTEMVLFEWLYQADTPVFKQVSMLLKEEKGS